MIARRPLKAAWFSAGTSLLAVLVLSQASSRADEKKEAPPKNKPIRVTGGAGNAAAPTPSLPDHSADGGMFDFLQKQTSGASDVEIPINSPSRSRNNSRQLQELRDRSENWIFLKPQDFSNDPLNQNKGPEEMFSLESEPGGGSGKNSKVIENFWNEGSAKPNAKAATSALAAEMEKPDQRNEKLFGPATPVDVRANNKIEAVNWNTLFNQPGKPDSSVTASRELYGTSLLSSGGQPAALGAGAGLPSALSTGTSLPEFSGKPKPAADEFSTLFKNSSPKLLTSSPNDPINSAKDSSAQDFNPVVGRRLNDAAKGVKSLESTPIFRGNNLPIASFTPGSLGELNARLAEQESQRPAFVPQPETKALRGKPAVLEFPKRNF